MGHLHGDSLSKWVSFRPALTRGDDERDSIGIFEEEFAFVGVPAADSGLRTILDSQEPPLNFAIQLLTSSFGQNVEVGLLCEIDRRCRRSRRRQTPARSRTYRTCNPRTGTRPVLVSENVFRYEALRIALTADSRSAIFRSEPVSSGTITNESKIGPAHMFVCQQSAPMP